MQEGVNGVRLRLSSLNGASLAGVCLLLLTWIRGGQFGSKGRGYKVRVFVLAPTRIVSCVFFMQDPHLVMLKTRRK